ncbi:hypothetical protein KFK09_015231 [Dendrobium nobile]|uniref:Uncharacterized protein n=1 Tax=Dendrobium nobile TaxID=94219 RepID=A0A8T3B658_DENNO|nr:hypothetical protein KFK09_015231 [Dendrobium nobile]
MEIRHLMPSTSSSMASFDANKMRLLNSHKEKEAYLVTGLGNNFQLELSKSEFELRFCSRNQKKFSDFFFFFFDAREVLGSRELKAFNGLA